MGYHRKYSRSMVGVNLEIISPLVAAAGGMMRRFIICALLAIGSGIIVAIGLSVLGHFRIWIFSDSLNTNLFIVGIAFLVIAYFSLTSTNEHDKRMPIFTSLTKIGKPSSDSSFINLIFFFIIAVVFGTFFAFLPAIAI